MTIGLAFRMRAELARLSVRHGFAARPGVIPLSAPVDGVQVFEGIAAAISIDNERVRFRPYAIALPGMLRQPNPPLLFRHDRNQVAGEVIELTHKSDGSLGIRCLVDHEEAKRCGGFSVAASIQAYELREIDDPQNFHALVTSATIDECSITDRPCNRDAILLNRDRRPPPVEAFDIARAGIAKAIEILDALRVIERTRASTSPPPPQPTRRERRIIPAPTMRRATQFASLVETLNVQHPC